MTAAVGSSTLSLVDEVGADPVERCDVCSHPLAAHDRVASRYCEATLHNALQRNCLCRA